jgi:hypothetical protein
MRTRRPTAPLSLRVEERETLEGWARQPKSAQALAQRSRIVLEYASGSPNTVLRTSSESPTRRSANRANGSWSGGWQDCWMSRGQAPRAKWWCA